MLVAAAILCVTLGLGRAMHEAFVADCFVTVPGVFSGMGEFVEGTAGAIAWFTYGVVLGPFVVCAASLVTALFRPL
jgi:hypothetical protein